MKTQKQLLLLLFILSITLHIVSAQIAIDSFSANTVQPGEEAELTISLENVGDEDIKNIIISLDLAELPFAPIESSSEQIIEEIQENEEETVSFQLQALADAEPRTYKIPVTISYENTTKSSLVSIEVSTEASIEVFAESFDLLMQNEQGKVTIKIINTGLTKIKFLQMTLQESSGYEILSSSSAYIGDIDIGDFETEEFTIIPLKKSTELEVEIEYRDANNELFTEKLELPLTVYTEEQAKELGLSQDGHTFTWILILGVIIIASIVFFRRKRKKNVY
ncbi:MAG: LPXTG cell wall anchor domain-containing protein [bacterium]|nr:LPXTG cell wall anchor domain-containing protein [bacterium]